MAGGGRNYSVLVLPITILTSLLFELEQDGGITTVLGYQRPMYPASLREVSSSSS